MPLFLVSHVLYSVCVCCSLSVTGWTVRNTQSPPWPFCSSESGHMASLHHIIFSSGGQQPIHKCASCLRRAVTRHSPCGCWTCAHHQPVAGGCDLLPSCGHCHQRVEETTCRQFRERGPRARWQLRPGTGAGERAKAWNPSLCHPTRAVAVAKSRPVKSRRVKPKPVKPKPVKPRPPKTKQPKSTVETVTFCLFCEPRTVERVTLLANQRLNPTLCPSHGVLLHPAVQ